jgi:predicted homoserine dehydrogenase-like protein
MRLAVVADLRRENALGAWEANGRRDAVEGTSAGAVEDAAARGRPVHTSDPAAAVAAPVDVVVEATGHVEAAIRTTLAAFERGKHVVMVTVEADVLAGARLRQMADRAGVVYTLADGDQPAVTYRLFEWARALGYRVVAAGRGTRRYPDDNAGVPEEAFARYGYAEELTTRRRFNPQMYNSFRDGSKAQIEMAALANATGLVPDRRGMHEPSAGVRDLPTLFRLRSRGGLLEREGVVDLANVVAADGEGDVPGGQANGVWVVVASDNPFLQEDLAFYGLPASEDKTHAVMYRPFHLCGTETPLSAAEACLYGRATAAALPRPVADVLTVAKRDLRAGDVLDGSGGRLTRGLIERAEVARSEGLLPLGLAPGARLRVDVAASQPIGYDQVDLPEGSLALRVRREQDASW